MRPSSRDIIESIIAAIDDTILPAVEDKQAASSLRAARTLLDHLAHRIEGETAMVADDNADALATLARLGLDAPAGRTAPQALNVALQEAVDSSLRDLPPAGREPPAQAEIRRELRAYLVRRHARERDMIIPSFLGAPF